MDTILNLGLNDITVQGLADKSGNKRFSLDCYRRLIQMFGDGIPTFHFQIIVGLYVVQIVFLLTILVNNIENGEDKLNEGYLIGTNLIKSTFLYVIVSLIIMIIFNMVAGMVISSI